MLFRLIAVLLLGALTACGNTVAGHPARQPPDLSGLEVGNYPVTPRVIGNASSELQGRVREGQRLADFVAHGFEVDPRFGFSSWGLPPHVITDRKSLGGWIINDTFDTVAGDLIVGYGTGSGTAANQNNAIVLINAVLLFPGEQTATRVADNLEHDDFTYEKTSQPIAIPGYPQARAHWVPARQGVSSWIAQGRYVLNTLVRDYVSPAAQPSADAAAVLIGKTLDTQLRLLTGFVPTPAGQVSHQPLDQDGMLSRTIPNDPDRPSRGDVDSVLGVRAALNEFPDPPAAQRELAAAGVDLIAFADGATFRTRDEQAATALLQQWTKPDQSTDLAGRMVPIGSPAGLNGKAQCFGPEKHSDFSNGILRCYVRNGRYAAQLVGTHPQEIFQKTSAQYALFGWA